LINFTLVLKPSFTQSVSQSANICFWGYTCTNILQNTTKVNVDLTNILQNTTKVNVVLNNELKHPIIFINNFRTFGIISIQIYSVVKLDLIFDFKGIFARDNY
jgi:hypothetical protein